MTLVLESYTYVDQSGFIQNRNLKDNLHKLYNIIDFVTGSHISALFYFVDTEKAFDQVEWH